MIRRVTLGFVTAALAGALLIVPAPVDAQTCSANADCGPGNTCAVKFDYWFFKWKWETDSHGKPLGACPQGTSCSSRGYCQRLQQ